MKKNTVWTGLSLTGFSFTCALVEELKEWKCESGSARFWDVHHDIKENELRKKSIVPCNAKMRRAPVERARVGRGCSLTKGWRCSQTVAYMLSRLEPVKIY